MGIVNKQILMYADLEIPKLFKLNCTSSQIKFIFIHIKFYQIIQFPVIIIYPIFYDAIKKILYLQNWIEK